MFEDGKDVGTSLFVHRSNSVSESLGRIGDYIQERDSQQSEYRRSTFESVLFKDELEGLNNKYIDQGRFGFETLDTSDVLELRNKSNTETTVVPRLGIQPSEHRIHPSGENLRPPDQYSEHYSSQNSPMSDSFLSEHADTDREDSSEASVLFDESSASDGIETAIQVRTLDVRKRKREQQMDHNQLTTRCLSNSLIGSLPNNQDTALSRSDSGLDIFSTKNAIWTEEQSVVNTPGNKSDSLVYVGNDMFFIQIAQILADQSISEPIALFEPFPKTTMDYLLEGNNSRTNYSDPLAQIIPLLFTHSKHCYLKEYTALNWMKSDPQLYGNSLPRAPIRPSMPQQQRALSGSLRHVFKLEPPYTCVRRAGTLIELSSSALYFWEELGLAPAHDTKDITAFCIFPSQDYIQDGVETFLSMMGSAYQSCNLGSHMPGSILPHYQKGLVPVTINSHRTHDVLEEVSRTCEKLGKKPVCII